MLLNPVIRIGVFTVLKLLVGFLLAKWVVLSIGPFGFSIYSLFQGLLIFLLQFFGLGAGQGIVRLVLKHNGIDRREDFNLDGSLLVLSGIMAAIFLVVLLFSKNLIVNGLLKGSVSYQQFWLGGIVLALTMFGSPWNFVRTAFDEGEKLVRNGFYFLTLSALLLYLFKPSLFGFLLVLMSYYLGQYIVAFFLDPRFWRSICQALRVKVADIRMTLQSVAPFMMMAFFMAFGQPFVQVVLRDDVSQSFGNVLMGKWQGVLRISDSISQVSSVVLTYFLLPKIIKESDDILQRQRVKEFIMNFIPIVSVVSITFWLFSDFFLRLLYDDSFTEVNGLVGYQAIGDIFRFCSYTIVQLVIAKANWKFAVFLDLLIAFFLYFSYTMLKERFGLESISIGYMISHCTYFFILLFSVLLKSD